MKTGNIIDKTLKEVKDFKPMKGKQIVPQDTR